jgi:hypothetical protein
MRWMNREVALGLWMRSNDIVLATLEPAAK